MDDQPNKIAQVIIDRSKCIGAATCVVIAPKAFDLDTEGLAVVKTTALEHTDSELIQAAQSCPTQAIKLIGKDGNELKL